MIDGQPLACFQPFIDTATGRIAGVEALGRLRQADGRLLSVGPVVRRPAHLRRGLAAPGPADPRQRLEPSARGTAGLVSEPEYLTALDQSPACRPGPAQFATGAGSRRRSTAHRVRDH